MQKLMELVQQLVHLLVGFPRWVQIFFFAVVFQLLLLVFIMIVYYVVLEGCLGAQRSTDRVLSPT